MSKNGGEYELAIKIAGEIEKSFYESTRLTKKEMREITKQAAMNAAAIESTYGGFSGRFLDGLKKAEPAFSGLEKMAKATFQTIATAASLTGGAVVTGLFASGKVGSEFESAFAGVEKTVSATDAELLQMRNNLREMARNEIPATAVELSSIAESAGQLGIKNENIVGYTKVMANMDVATNLDSETAASEFAKFANITGMDQSYFENLGSSVVALGNNMATTEADIVSMGMRIAAAGDQIGLSEADIMAYSAALSSVGIEAEAGGTAFSKLMSKLQLAAETGEGLTKYAKVAGMTGSEFKQAFSEDATGAINAFLTGLKNTEQNGMSAIAILEDMGLTEVRLRDTLLRASNASEMFDSALELSSEAWEENTALANEAEQRYKTFESQCTMTGNKIKDFGISIYDDMRPGLTEGISLVNSFLDSMGLQEDAIGDLIKAATEKMPTFARKMKESGEAVGNFAEPFLNVGKWLVDNPGLLVGTIAGVGSAIAAYKVASGIASITTALSALTPAGMAFMALGGIVSVFTGISASVKKTAAEAKKANLDAHFGNITLSISELQEAAASIIQSQNLDTIRESIVAMDDAKDIARSIEDTTQALNKMNWKVSVGMELSESEQEEYRNQIESYITSTQDYLTQKQYAVNLAVGVLTDDDMEGNDIVTKVNDFYAGKQEELANLGTKMNETITNAFQDGLLDIDEIKEITELQSQMAKIESSLAGSEYDANLELMKMRYSVGDLDAESFKNLQAELQEQTAAASEDYEKSFVLSVSNADVMLKEGAINQEEYDAMVTEYRENYLAQVGDLQAKAIDFQTEIIMGKYGGEIDLATLRTDEMIDEFLGNAMSADQYGGPVDWNAEAIYSIYGNSTLDDASKAALTELWEYLQPQFEQQYDNMMEQYIAVGEDIPESVAEGMRDTAAIGALVGDSDALYYMLSEETKDNPAYQEMIESMWEQGYNIPEQIAAGIIDNKEIVRRAMEEVTGEVMGDTGLDFSLGAGTAKNTAGKTAKGVNIRHADGGIFDTPHVAWVAEAGAESIIPLDRSQNAIDLWEQTGRLLGMDGLSGGVTPLSIAVEEAASSAGSPVINISNGRTINFNGNAPSREEIEEILEDEDEKFARLVARYVANNKRTSFR